MIPTGTLIPQELFVASPTLGAILGPAGACLLVAVVAAFAVSIVTMIHEPRMRGLSGRILPRRPAEPSSAPDQRRSAA